jgi:hypothetical protein
MTRNVLIYVNIRGPGPIVDSKALSLEVPGDKTNEEVYEIMRSIFQGLIDAKCKSEASSDVTSKEVPISLTND